ncbi:MAG: flagellar basal-body rod protein FlgG [Gammaproteobacteria bacterium]
MADALSIAKTGLEAQQKRMAVTSNNLANINTTGFKRSRAVFEDLLYQTEQLAGTQSSEDTTLNSGLVTGTGVRIVATEKIFTQGNIVQTGNNMDMAIEGRGFFQILVPDGSIAYSRDGTFQMDAQGQMVTAKGYALQPGITIPQDALSITIGKDGVVSVSQPGNPTPTEVGTVQLSDFVNPAGLQPIGQNLFLETAASGSPQTGTAGLNGLGTLSQGSLETSNVNTVEELVGMIETQRAYEINAKAISTIEQMLEYANNNL